ncbi:unnamed protein product [Trichobilharzia szidati]|nr:unnamed protein product [Trichobilharzia szidati]
MSYVDNTDKVVTDEPSQMIHSIFSLLYIFGGAIPYIPQLIEIRKTQSVKGFSTHVCLVLLLSNILRICFWFVQPFSSSLLSQSFVMIITMLVLMKTITKISRMKRSASIPSTISTKKSETEDQSMNRFKKILFENFWRWTHFRHYLLFLWLFTLTSGLCTYIFSFSQVYIQLLGFSALFIEAMLGAPQFLENYKNKSVVGMSIAMVLMWTSGDIFKTIFFISEKAPLQFPICGLLQIGLDLAILLQCLYYKGERFM